MPYKRAVKVSDRVYERLRELAKAAGLESPNQVLEVLLSVEECIEATLATVQRRSARSRRRLFERVFERVRSLWRSYLQ